MEATETTFVYLVSLSLVSTCCTPWCWVIPLQLTFEWENRPLEEKNKRSCQTMINARGVVVDGGQVTINPVPTAQPLCLVASSLVRFLGLPLQTTQRTPQRIAASSPDSLSISPELVGRICQADPPRQSSSSGLRERAGAIKARSWQLANRQSPSNPSRGESRDSVFCWSHKLNTMLIDQGQ